MPILVHLADERDSDKILSGGLKIGKWRKGIFFMPVTQDFNVSHQWLRELKRRGIRTYVGVYFHLSSDEMVWFGKYHKGHQKMELGKALSEFLKTEDKLGFEFLIDRKIKPKEIEKIRHLPQTLGWRYSPDSHNRKLGCACPICISPGEINGRKKREKIEPKERTPALREIIEKLRIETDEIEIGNLFSFLRTKKRRTDPEELRFIVESKNISPIQDLAMTLEYFRHPNATKMLTELCSHKDDEVREFSAKGLLSINRTKGLEILAKYKEDEIVSQVMKDFSTDE